jgi:hypothetical protein
VSDPRIAGDDLVVSPFGLAVRAHLLEDTGHG